MKPATALKLVPPAPAEPVVNVSDDALDEEDQMAVEIAISKGRQRVEEPVK